MTTFTTKQAIPTSEPEFWYEGSTGISDLGGVTFSVVELRGSTVEAQVETGLVEPEVSWAGILNASARTSFAFLDDEPNLYDED